VISTSCRTWAATLIGFGRLLAGSVAISATALPCCALALAYWVIVACAVLFGLSAVAVDAALNAYAARHLGARQVNLMHAAYGIGAASSPLIVTAVIGMGRSWRWAYITVMAIQALLAALFAGTLRRWRDASAEPVAVAAASKEDQSPGRPRWWRRAPAVGGLLVGAVQTGLESAIGLWAFVYLLSAVALPAATAGVIVSSYWAAIVLGRILLGALAQRIGIWPVLGTLTTIAVTASVLLLTRQPVLAAGGIILLGLALAPVYPLLVLTTAERTTAGATDRLVGLRAAVSTIGAVVFPTAVGLIMGVNPMASRAASSSSHSSTAVDSGHYVPDAASETADPQPRRAVSCEMG
jgi:fucose permease